MRCAVLLALAGAALPALATDDGEFFFGDVTYGSTLKLKHRATGYRLHSHQVNWGSGSHQQSVTAVKQADDPNSLWLVKEAWQTEPQPLGLAVRCGDRVRLEHLQTQRNLHTHRGFAAPLSGQMEVSAFGEEGEGDGGDDWEVVCLDKGDTWARGQGVRLKSAATGSYLHSSTVRFTQSNCPNCPIVGQAECSAFRQANDDNVWETDQGVYMPHLEFEKLSSPVE